MYTFKLYNSEQLVELMYMNALKYDKETHSFANWKYFNFGDNANFLIAFDGDASVNVNDITGKTPLVLINTTHMCHAAYHKVKNRLNDIGTEWEYIYPCYRGATNINSVNK